MSTEQEIKYFIEDLQKEEIKGLFAVRLFISDKESIAGKKPPYPAPVVTCIPPGDWGDDAEVIRESLWKIAEVMRKRFEGA